MYGQYGEGLRIDSDDSILDVEKFSVVKVKGGRSGPALHIVVTARGLNVNVVYRFECQCGFRGWMSMWATGLNVNVVYGF